MSDKRTEQIDQSSDKRTPQDDQSSDKRPRGQSSDKRTPREHQRSHKRTGRDEQSPDKRAPRRKRSSGRRSGDVQTEQISATKQLSDTLALFMLAAIDWASISFLVSQRLKENCTPDEIHDYFLNSYVSRSGISKVDLAHIARLITLRKLEKAKQRAAARRLPWLMRAKAWIKA